MAKKKSIPINRGSVTEDIKRDKELDVFTAPKAPSKIKARKSATEDLCRRLDEPTGDFDRNTWIVTLEKYNSEYDRPYYSSITDYIYNSSNRTSDDNHEWILANIQKVVDWAEQTDYQEQKTVDYEKLIRFQDHVSLAVRQYRMFNERAKGLDDQITSKTKEIADERIREMTKDITGQLIGLVAIFTALSFVVFGGISSLDSILGSLKEYSELTSTLMVAAAWTFCMGNLLFAFMYFILKSTGKEVNRAAKNHVQKYPLTWLLNFICVSIFVVCAAIHFAWRNGIGKGVYQWALNHDTLVFWVGMVAVIVFIASFGQKLFNLYYQKEGILERIIRWLWNKWKARQK